MIVEYHQIGCAPYGCPLYFALQRIMYNVVDKILY